MCHSANNAWAIERAQVTFSNADCIRALDKSTNTPHMRRHRCVVFWCRDGPEEGEFYVAVTHSVPQSR